MANLSHLSAGTRAGGLLVIGYLGSAAAVALHALLTKPDPRSVVSWIALCWLFPIGGSVLYWLFGINRVSRHSPARLQSDAQLRAAAPDPRPARVASSPQSGALECVGDALTGLPLLGGNTLEPLSNGEVAFRRMLQAIRAAKHSVWLATYIFETDAVGREFIAALQDAVARGVSARALVDGIGEWYDWPHAVPLLRRAGVAAARFP